MEWMLCDKAVHLKHIILTNIIQIYLIFKNQDSYLPALPSDNDLNRNINILDKVWGLSLHISIEHYNLGISKNFMKAEYEELQIIP